MHIFADAFTQNDMHCIHYKDFYQFMRSLGIEILDHSTFWGYSTYNQYLFTYIIIYKAPDKHGKKVTYQSLDAKPKYLVENNMHMKTDFNRKHMKTSIRNAKVSSTYENECEMHRFHPCWRRWAQYPDASTRERTLLLMSSESRLDTDTDTVKDRADETHPKQSMCWGQIGQMPVQTTTQDCRELEHLHKWPMYCTNIINILYIIISVVAPMQPEHVFVLWCL